LQRNQKYQIKGWGHTHWTFRVFAASSLGGAAREKYAAMEAGGGAVAAPPKKGQLKDLPAAGRRGRKSGLRFQRAPGGVEERASSLLLTLRSPGFSQKKGKQARKQQRKTR
jgi:hypothetical protein